MTETPSTAARPQRVLHIGKYFSPHRGGMETYLQDIMAIQARAGIVVSAVVHGSTRSLADVIEEAPLTGGNVCQITRAARWFNIGFIPISPLFWLSVRRAIKQFRPDVLHIHHPNSSGAFLLFLPSARAIPWTITWHSDILTPGASLPVRFGYALYRLFERWQLSVATRIIATSPPYMEASEPLQAVRDKIECISLELDAMRLPHPDSVEPLPRPEAPLVLCVGRLAIYKGHLDLLEAMVDLPSVHLWIVGEGEERASIEAKIRELGLQNRVELLGAVEDDLLWRYYKTCDVFCLASDDRTEAFGVVLLEAAHFGKPVVVRPIPGSGVGWVARRLCGADVARGMSNRELKQALARATKMLGVLADSI